MPVSTMTLHQPQPQLTADTHSVTMAWKGICSTELTRLKGLSGEALAVVLVSASEAMCSSASIFKREVLAGTVILMASHLDSDGIEADSASDDAGDVVYHQQVCVGPLIPC